MQVLPGLTALFYLGFDGITGLLPGGEPAQDGGNVLEAIIEQNARRTGAGFLARSGAIGDDPLVGVEFGLACF